MVCKAWALERREGGRVARREAGEDGKDERGRTKRRRSVRCEPSSSCLHKKINKGMSWLSRLCKLHQKKVET